MQKTVQNDKKFCLSGFISQEPYIIWSSFMVHICKMIISPGFFFFNFSKLIFWVVWRVEMQKTVQNDKKILSVMLYISGTIHNMIAIYGTHDNISRLFFQFFKILIFWVVDFLGKRAKSGPKNDKKFCLFCSISQVPSILWLPFMVQDFLGFQGAERAKKGTKLENFLSVSLCISGTVNHMIVIFGTHV